MLTFLKCKQVIPKVKALILLFPGASQAYELAKVIADGIKLSGGDADICRLPDILSLEVFGLEQLNLSEIESKFQDIPRVEFEEITKYNAYFFGVPSNNNAIVSQFSNFLTILGANSKVHPLNGKLASAFSPESEGNEEAKVGIMCCIVNFGMIFVGFPTRKSTEGLTQKLFELNSLKPEPSEESMDDDRDLFDKEVLEVRNHSKNVTKLAVELTECPEFATPVKKIFFETP